MKEKHESLGKFVILFFLFDDAIRTCNEVLIGDFALIIPWAMEVTGSGNRWAWDYITPKRRQGIYLVYKRYFYCQLGDYMLPIPPIEPETSVDIQVTYSVGKFGISTVSAHPCRALIAAFDRGTHGTVRCLLSSFCSKRNSASPSATSTSKLSRYACTPRSTSIHGGPRADRHKWSYGALLNGRK